MPELHPVLAARWSPRAFDPDAELTADELTSLLEAARWAPSASNSQPWRFVVGLRHDDTHKRIFANLAPGNQRWAGTASALLVAAHVSTSAGGAPLRHAAYDVGQAVAHLSVQATATGLHVHQMAGFDAAGLRADLTVENGIEIATVVALGRLGDPGSLSPDLRERELGLRTRRPISELLL